jgi:RNA polymerase sigma-70 factor (ECF subfamily)
MSAPGSARRWLDGCFDARTLQQLSRPGGKQWPGAKQQPFSRCGSIAEVKDAPTPCVIEVARQKRQDLGGFWMEQVASQVDGTLADQDTALGELVQRAQHGEHAAFAALFERYNAPLCRYLVRLVGNVEIGHDLAQDTFLKAWRSLPTLRDGERFSPWLYQIATNLARSHARRARLIHWLPWSGPLESTAGSSRLERPEDLVGEAEQVLLALAELPPKRRACVLLALEGGFTHREIARLLGISEKSVDTYLSRGCQQFRLAYKRLANGYASKKGGPAR